MSVNSVVMVGNLCRDPEIRKNQNGTSILSFTMAINERYRSSATNTWESKAVYVPCTVFGNYADTLVKYMFKGTEVLVSGRLNFRMWESDGQTKTKLEVIASEAKVLRQPGSTQTQSSHGAHTAQSVSSQDYAPIPF